MDNSKFSRFLSSSRWYIKVMCVPNAKCHGVLRALGWFNGAALDWATKNQYPEPGVKRDGMLVWLDASLA